WGDDEERQQSELQVEAPVPEGDAELGVIEGPKTLPPEVLLPSARTRRARKEERQVEEGNRGDDLCVSRREQRGGDDGTEADAPEDERLADRRRVQRGQQRRPLDALLGGAHRAD